MASLLPKCGLCRNDTKADYIIRQEKDGRIFYYCDAHHSLITFLREVYSDGKNDVDDALASAQELSEPFE